MRLIVTRPEPDATRTAEALIRLGHVAILSPTLDVTPVPRATLPDELFQAVLVTSSNGDRALAGIPDRSPITDIPLLAVGDRTALEAKRAGFAEARSAGGAVDDLVTLVAAGLDPAAGPLLYVSGDVTAGNLAERLQARGFDVRVLILYRAVARKRLAGVARDALKAGTADGILLYSPRSAAAFADALRADGLAPLGPHITCFCLSESVAAALAAVTTGPVLIAPRPDQISLFGLIERAGEAQA
jgi:uroporphyrinogen-III synthase